MNLNLRIEASGANAAQALRRTAPSTIPLGQLIELVASIVPAETVAETVAALFDRRIAFFARGLTSDERAALRSAS